MAECEAGREQTGTEDGPPTGAFQFLSFQSGPRAAPRHELGCFLPGRM